MIPTPGVKVVVNTAYARPETKILALGQGDDLFGTDIKLPTLTFANLILGQEAKLDDTDVETTEEIGGFIAHIDEPGEWGRADGILDGLLFGAKARSAAGKTRKASKVVSFFVVRIIVVFWNMAPPISAIGVPRHTNIECGVDVGSEGGVDFTPDFPTSTAIFSLVFENRAQGVHGIGETAIEPVMKPPWLAKFEMDDVAGFFEWVHGRRSDRSGILGAVRFHASPSSGFRSVCFPGCQPAPIRAKFNHPSVRRCHQNRNQIPLPPRCA